MKCGFFFDEESWINMMSESDYDFYHLPGYLRIERELIGGDQIFFFYESNGSKALIPLMKRSINNTRYFDLSSPYGYPGILINRSFEYRKYNHVLKEFSKCCAQNDIVSAFLRLNPILNNYLFSESENLMQEVHGRTVFIPLSKPYEILEAHYSSNHKRNIKKLKKQGFSVKINSWSSYEQWQQLYIETMNRLEASNYYFFNKTYFQELHELLGKNLILLTVYDIEENLTSGGLFTNYNGVIQYHLGGTKEEYLSSAPSKLMFDEMIRWGVNEKCKILHLGGGVGGEKDSLFTFKSGFSKNTMHFSTLRLITNSYVYKVLTKERFNEMPDNKKNEIEFFPLYRF